MPAANAEKMCLKQNLTPFSTLHCYSLMLWCFMASKAVLLGGVLLLSPTLTNLAFECYLLTGCHNVNVCK